MPPAVSRSPTPSSLITHRVSWHAACSTSRMTNSSFITIAVDALNTVTGGHKGSDKRSTKTDDDDNGQGGTGANTTGVDATMGLNSTTTSSGGGTGGDGTGKTHRNKNHKD